MPAYGATADRMQVERVIQTIELPVDPKQEITGNRPFILWVRESDFDQIT